MYYVGSICFRRMNDLGLGPLEMEVLGTFRRGEGTSVADVQTRLSRSGRELAYTTVMTVLSRLHEKGVLTRKREGKRYLYTAGRRTGRVIGRMVDRIHKALFKSARLD